MDTINYTIYPQAADDSDKMPAVRRASVFGKGGSLVLVLPRDWANGQGIRAGDVVEILYGSGRAITVRPLARPADE